MNFSWFKQDLSFKNANIIEPYLILFYLTNYFIYYKKDFFTLVVFYLNYAEIKF